MKNQDWTVTVPSDQCWTRVAATEVWTTLFWYFNWTRTFHSGSDSVTLIQLSCRSRGKEAQVLLLQDVNSEFPKSQFIITKSRILHKNLNSKSPKMLQRWDENPGFGFFTGNICLDLYVLELEFFFFSSQFWLFPLKFGVCVLQFQHFLSPQCWKCKT